MAVALAACGSQAPTQEGTTPASAPADKPLSLDLTFINHLQMDLPEQDVLIEKEPGKIYRVTKGDNDMGAQIYASAKGLHHDPFNPDGLGPFEKGKDLGFTLGDWLKGAGTGKYTCENGTGNLDINFTGLIPNGVYTMWHAFIALPPTQPFTGTLDIPVGARDGSDSVFKADAEGNASFKRTFQPCLQMTGEYATSMLAIAYHSDGKTYQGSPGDFASVTHVQLMAMFPKREGL